MNMILRTCLLFTLLALISGCKDPSASGQKMAYDELFAEVMRVHDEVMPETANLYKLKKYAQDDLEILPENHEFVEQLVKTKIAADKADDAMMDWMAEFKVPESSHDEKMKYLKSELSKIKEVSHLIKSTIADGRKFIKKVDHHIHKNNLKKNG